MVIVLGDLLADYVLRVPGTSGTHGEAHPAAYLELGPGGACNVAITVARLGLPVLCLGEVGHDLFGEVVVDGLKREGIDASAVAVTAGARTPVATVLVDDRGEPAYLGYPGSLRLSSVPDAWRPSLTSAEALFVDGWAEHAGAPELFLEAISTAVAANVPFFFDPGPGNPHLDNSWQVKAAGMATVILVTEGEAHRLTGIEESISSARSLLSEKTRLIIIKRGAAGCLLVAQDEVVLAPGFPVVLTDATGAGDSFAAAVLFGYLRGLNLKEMGELANATGAAKVMKMGTGHSMPTAAEIRAILERFGRPSSRLL